MPIRPEMRGFYSSDWPEISRRVRFERAAGVCQGCGRPHGITVRCLPDGQNTDHRVEIMAPYVGQLSVDR
jgi:hypothetical protein